MMCNFCDEKCAECMLVKVFEFCPRGFVEDDEISRVTRAYKMGLEDGLNLAARESGEGTLVVTKNGRLRVFSPR